MKQSTGIEINMTMPVVGFAPIAEGKGVTLAISMLKFDPEKKLKNFFNKEDDKEYHTVEFKLTCTEHPSDQESVGRTALVSFPLCVERSADLAAYIDALPDSARGELGWFHDEDGNKFPVGAHVNLRGIEDANEIISDLEIVADVSHSVVEKDGEKRTYVRFRPKRG